MSQSLSEAQQLSAIRPDLTQKTGNFGAVSSSNPNLEPVNHLFEAINGIHFFTASRAKFQALTTPGTSAYRADLTYEPNITFYKDSTLQPGYVAERGGRAGQERTEARALCLPLGPSQSSWGPSLAVT